eukprot:scaffold33524_cov90-Isochrysis_galbana.AAC.1
MWYGVAKYGLGWLNVVWRSKGRGVNTAGGARLSRAVRPAQLLQLSVCRPVELERQMQPRADGPPLGIGRGTVQRDAGGGGVGDDGHGGGAGLEPGAGGVALRGGV